METITLNIDGQEVKTEKGKSVLEAALDAGIYIPTLCYHPDLSSTGACRLCVVEIEGTRGLPTACTTPATDGMVVKTNTPQLQESRREVLALILSEHPHYCLDCWRRERCGPSDICLRSPDVGVRCVTCANNQHCELQQVANYVGVTESSLPYTSKKQPVHMEDPLFYRDYNLCILCGRCVRACNELRGVGAISLINRGKETYIGTAFDRSLADANCRFCCTCVEVCPTGALKDKTALPETEKEREAVLVPCKNTCPAGIDIPRYIRLIRNKKYTEAAAVIREKVPFPNVLGHICAHPCELACRRNELNEAVSIRALKRFAAGKENKLLRKITAKMPPTGKKVAIVGSGPAGLTAAYYLSKLGHSVTVFEALPASGGMLRVGIPEYRLPKKVLDEEIKEIQQVGGFEIKTNTRIESLDNLFAQGYNAAFLAIGAHKGNKVGVPGDDSPGVIDAIALLRDVVLGQKVNLGDKTVVIGGGNVAIDAARTAVRLGTKDVTIMYRRTQAEMPADPEEIKGAEEEGVKFIFLATPNKIWNENGVVKLQCIRMELGEVDASGRRRPVPIKGSEFIISCSSVIAAIGQVMEVPATFKVATGRGGVIQTKDNSITSREGVFAGGDIVTSPVTVIQAIASGRQGAIAIDKYLGGSGIIDEVLAPVEEPSAWLGCEEGFAHLHREEIPCLPAEIRTSGFVEVERGYNEETALKEALRCLQCDLRVMICPVKLPPKSVQQKELVKVV
ncbi:MAG: FAD-dependent oxidoreductase [Chloroflexota bacterium]